MNKILIFLFLLFNLSAVAQSSTDHQLANQYFRNKEFDKALPYFEKLFEKQPSFYYSPYIKCLIALKEYEKAEKIIKKRLKNDDKSYLILVDLGYLYSVNGESNKVKTQYEKAIKEVPADPQAIITLASAFAEKNELDYAIATYQHGRKVMNGAYGFHIELADLYSRKQDIPSMMNEYLEVLSTNEAFLQNIQNVLQANVLDDPTGNKGEYIKNLLLKKIQAYPDRLVFSELLTWLFIQQKDFESAFIQKKAVDKRLRENGDRIMQLAQVCIANEDFETASKCYQYVMSKGKDSPLYLSARMGYIDAVYRKVTHNNLYTKEDLLSVEKEYVEALNDFGKNSNTAPLVRGLSHVRAFYLHKIEEAVKPLEEIVAVPNLNPQVKAECKIELADIYLMQGEIWEATLLYSQVELDFKATPLGDEARLKNARLSYYHGDFVWAQQQLDILKSGTARVIANDAMSLSLLISDNIDLSDSNTAPLKMYSRADLLAYQNKDPESIKTLDSITAVYPIHSLGDEVLYKKAEILKKKENYESAYKLLEELLNKYSEDIWADDALFALAEMNEKKFNNTAKAMEQYQQLLTKYPASLFVTESRKRFRILRGDPVN